jgi:hypothetical protein
LPKLVALGIGDDIVQGSGAENSSLSVRLATEMILCKVGVPRTRILLEADRYRDGSV